MNITNHELLSISIKIERDGKAFYSKLAEISLDPQVSNFFHLMSKEEAMHENQLTKLIESKQSADLGWENDAALREFIDKEFQTDIFPLPEEVIDQLSTKGGIHKALDFAMDAERIVGEFFHLLHDSCNDIEIKTLLTVLEKSESEHLERVKSFRSLIFPDSN